MFAFPSKGEHFDPGHGRLMKVFARGRKVECRIVLQDRFYRIGAAGSAVRRTCAAKVERQDRLVRRISVIHGGLEWPNVDLLYLCIR